MKWLNNLSRIFSKSISVEESWVQMTTSLRQADFHLMKNTHSRSQAYASGSLVVTNENSASSLGPVKHQCQEIFPSVLNRLEGKFKATRITKRKKR